MSEIQLVAGTVSSPATTEIHIYISTSCITTHTSVHVENTSHIALSEPEVVGTPVVARFLKSLQVDFGAGRPLVARSTHACMTGCVAPVAIPHVQQLFDIEIADGIAMSIP